MNKIAVVSKDPEFATHVHCNRMRLASWVAPGKASKDDVFAAVSISALDKYSSEFRQIMAAPKFRLLFLRADALDGWLIERLIDSGLTSAKFFRRILPYTSWIIPNRVINAWADGSESVLIADAAATDQNLIIRNCALEKIEIAWNKIPILAAASKEQRSKFEIDETGSFIKWSELDVDLDFDSLRYLIDPEWQKKCDGARISAERGFGYAVKGLREFFDLTQSEIEAKTGISERQLRRYETNGMQPRFASLEKLAQAHGFEFNEYLEKLAQAVNGPTAIIVSCNSANAQVKLTELIEQRMFWLKDSSVQCLPVRRRKGSKDHETWKQARFSSDGMAGDQLGLAIPIDSAKAFDTLWKYCEKECLYQKAAVGLNSWPSQAFVPTDSDYVLAKLKQRH